MKLDFRTKKSCVRTSSERLTIAFETQTTVCRHSSAACGLPTCSGLSGALLHAFPLSNNQHDKVIMSHISIGVPKSSLGLLLVLCASACSSESTPTPAAPPDSGVPTTDEPTSGTPDASTSPTTSDAADGGATDPLPDASDGGETTLEDGGSTLDGGETITSVLDGGSSAPATTVDAGETSDGGVSDPWNGCPAVAEPSNPSWPIGLRATEDAVYCAMINENRTLQEEQRAKLQLRVAAGDHRVPDVDTSPFALPICVRDKEESWAVTSGSVTAVKSEGEGTTSYSLGFTQEFGDADARRFQMSLDQSFPSGETVEFVLNGTENAGLESYQSMDLCEVDGQYCFPTIIFTSCSYESGELNTHTVEFEGGEVTFDLRIGDSFAGTEPGAFVEARGTYADAAFLQKDYFKLVYHPAHHHFERAFVVLFDEPLAGACGIEVSGLEPFGDDVPDAAFTVDCNLEHLDELTVTSHSLLRGSP